MELREKAAIKTAATRNMKRSGGKCKRSARNEIRSRDNDVGFSAAIVKHFLESIIDSRRFPRSSGLTKESRCSSPRRLSPSPLAQRALRRRDERNDFYFLVRFGAFFSFFRLKINRKSKWNRLRLRFARALATHSGLVFRFRPAIKELSVTFTASESEQSIRAKQQ